MGKVTILKTLKALCSYQGLPLMETVLTDPNSVGFYQSLTDLKKWKYPTPVPSNLPASSKGGWGEQRNEEHLLGSQLRDTGSLKDLA